MKVNLLKKSLFLFSVILTLNYNVNAQCPGTNSDGVFDPTSDILMTTYHASIVKVTSGLVCWGEDLMPNGNTDATSVIAITNANGYNYTGTVVHHAVSGNSGTQAFLATTTNLYAWGRVGEVVDNSFVIDRPFAPMIGIPFNSADVIQMHASSDVLFVVINTGEVFVATTGTTVPNGTDDTNGDIWHQVETSSGVPLTGVTQLTGNKSAGYALTATGDIYAWGNNIELGDGVGVVNLDFATLMIAPPSVPVTIASIFGDSNDPGLLVLGTDTKIYGCGNNTTGEIITTGTGVVNTWTAIQNSGGTDFVGAINIATSHTSEDYPGVAIITNGATVTDPNILYTWGQNDNNSLGHSTAVVQNPTIPASFNVGVDNPVSVSVGGHATTFFNVAGTGSICFVGHISSGSTGGLTVGTGTTFECIMPGGFTFCGVSVNTEPSQGNETLTIDEDDALTTSGNLLINNIDPDGTTTSITTIVSSTGGGTTAINGNGIDYTPASNFNGIDTVIYTVCDQGLPLPIKCVNDTLFITVNPIVDVPSQGNETMTVDEDDAVTTSSDLLTNNIDPDGTITSITTILSSTGGGTTAINGNGIDYTPASNFNGIDTVIYTVCDNDLPTSSCVNDTLFITVNAVNDAPNQGNETLIINEDDAVTTSGNLVINNIDPDGTITSITTIVSSTGGGIAVINGNGIDYTPASNFNGIDTVIYTVCDNDLPTSSCVNDTLFVTVNPIVDTPSQGNETLTVDEDDAVTTSGNLLINNIDPDGTTTLITTILSSTGGGTTAINGNGIDYTPASNFNGIDTVIYTVCDSDPTPLCVNDTLFITVNAVNDAPSQGNETLIINEDDAVTTSGNLVTNNIDPDGTITSITTIVSSTGGGITVINGNGIDYTPASNFNGIDTVIYTVCDSGSPTSSCVNDTLFVTVNPIVDAPSQGNETLTVDEDDAVTTSGNLLINNIDPDGTTTSITTILSSTGGGTTAINGNGIDYTPASNFNGIDTVIYTVCDSDPTPLCVNDTLFITVNAVNDAPSQGNETLIINEDDAVTTSGNLVTNNIDPDGTITSITTIVSSTGGGTTAINGNGIDYTPASNFNGIDTVIYTVCDFGSPTSSCVNDTLFVTVNPIVDVSSQGNETLTVDEDDAVTTSGNLLINNIDPDGTTTSITTILSSTGGGTTVINGNGIDYTPASNFNGIDTVIYTVCDSDPTPLCVNDTLFITVNAVNDAPIVDNEFHTTTDITSISGDLTDSGDSDPEGTLLNATTIVDVPVIGSIFSFNTDGTYTYTPLVGFVGIDTIVVEICDSGLPMPTECINDTLFITVTSNLPPNTENETETTLEETAVNGDALTAADTDPEGGVLTVNTTPIVLPQNGSFTIASDGTYTYTPNTNFVGNDTIIVLICDDGMPVSCANDTIFIVVTPVSDAPSQGNETLGGIAEDELTATTSGSLTLNNIDPDGTSTAVTVIVSSTGGGTTTITGGGTTIDYIPVPNFTGIDTVIYTVCDGGLPTVDCVNDTLFVTVDPVNDPPVGTDAGGLGNETLGGITEDETTVTTSINLLANNMDPDGTALTVTTIVSSTGGATTTITGGGSTIDYIPAPNFTGIDTVIYTVCDSGTPLPVECINDTLFVTVDPVNDPPVGTDVGGLGNETLGGITEDETTATTSTDLLANNIDPDGTVLTVTTIVSSTGGGTTSITGGGSTIDYIPALNFAGVDTVIYTVCDNGTPLPVECINDTLFVTVDPVNDAPTQGNETLTGVQLNETNPTTSIDLTLNNTDVDGTVIVTAIVSTTGGGTVTNNGDGTVDYTPLAGFFGTDTVIYTVCDDGFPLPIECVNDTLFVIITDCLISDLLSDCDGDGVTNGTEVTDGTDANDPCDYLTASQTVTTSAAWNVLDCDGDGVTNETETTDGTDGTDPCAYLATSQTVTTSAVWNALDCDGDGTTNGTDSDPLDPCTDGTTGNEDPTNPIWQAADCDGDGVTNGTEITDGTDGTDPCDYLTASQTLTTSVIWDALDCDGDGVINGTELTDGTDATNPCDYLIGSQTVTTSTIWDGLDCDGDGTTNGTDSDPLDPCTDGTTGNEDTTNPIWQAADCDGDGVTNGTETTDGTDANDPCDYLVVSQTVTVSAAWNALDCDGDGVVNGTEIADATDATDPCDYLVGSQTVTTSTIWDALDCDGDGTTNGTDSDPLDPCTDGTTGNEDTTNPIWQAADCDGDGVTNGTEITDGTDANDPCDYLVGSQTVTVSVAWSVLDCDGDGVTNGTETTDGTDANDPCDYLVASQTVTVSAAWNALDCDGDGTTNGTDSDPLDPCTDGTTGNENTTNPIWQTADCDGDGVTNGTETTDGTNPNDPCDFNDQNVSLEVTSFCGLEIPEGFSPNNDGVNDMFVIAGIEAYDNVNIIIFNRWGNKVYESNSYTNDWDGTNSFGLTYGDEILPTGTYFYVVDLGDESDIIKGYVYLNK